MIPKIIHQTWKTAAVPVEWQFHVNSWKWQHPTWEYKFWTDQDGLELIEEQYPELLETYINFPYAIQRADLLRYVILYHFGGIYADIDYECLQPFDDLMEGSNFIIGYEPQEHSVEFNKPELLCNALIASSPGNSFLALLIDHINNHKHRAISHLDVLKTTGPFMMTDVYNDYYKEEEITIFPSHVLCPVSNYSHELHKLSKQDMESNQIKLNIIANGGYAIHYWSNSWVGKLAGDLINPEPDNIEGFTFHQGVDSPQNDLFNGGRDIQKLAARCRDDQSVLAFNTDGFAKFKILEKEKWQIMPGAPSNEGLYIKNLVKF